MPEEILELNMDDIINDIDNNDINNFENDCEKVRSLADEYLHDRLLLVRDESENPGESENIENIEDIEDVEILREPELSEEDKIFIENHIADCKECSDFIEEEKKYLDEVSLAGYVPEISISQYVMDKIIENKMTVDKPAKRRIFPVGLLSAAAVVIIMFALARSGPLDLFIKKDNVKNAVNPAPEYTTVAELNAAYGTLADDLKDGQNNNEKPEAPEVPEEPRVFMVAEDSISDEGEAGGGYNDDVVVEEDMPMVADADTGMPMAEEVYPENITAAVEAIEAETEATLMMAPPPMMIPKGGDGYMSYDDFLAINNYMVFEKIYRINFNDIADKEEIIFEGIEFSAMDQTGKFDIIEKMFDERLIKNLQDNQINVEEWIVENIDGVETQYIGIIYDME